MDEQEWLAARATLGATLFQDGIENATRSGRQEGPHQLGFEFTRRYGPWPQCACGYQPAAEEARYSVEGFEALFRYHFQAAGVPADPSPWTRIALWIWRTRVRARQ